MNNGTAVRRVDCGPGEDTIYINPRTSRGGISNSQALREGRIRNCEDVIAEKAAAPPATRGIKRFAGSGGAVLEGTERNDNLLGGGGSDTIWGRGGDDVIWGNRLPSGRPPAPTRCSAARARTRSSAGGARPTRSTAARARTVSRAARGPTASTRATATTGSASRAGGPTS